MNVSRPPPLLLSIDWDAFSGTRELVFDAPIWGTRDREEDRLQAWRDRARRRGGPGWARSPADAGSVIPTGTSGCAYAYKSFPTGIMPERYNMALCPGKDHRQGCAWNEATFAEEAAKRYQYKADLPKGFTTAKDPRYILRPEAIESIFVLWRITGDESFRETAWDMFEAVAKATETEYANAAVMDVNVLGGGKKEDYMESFWMAETLKYFYLCFADTDLISLDEFVLNTEAHPFRLST